MSVGIPKCNLLLAQARPRMIQHLSSAASNETKSGEEVYTCSCLGESCLDPSVRHTSSLHTFVLFSCTIDFCSKLFSSVYTFCLYTGLSDRLAVGS